MRRHPFLFLIVAAILRGSCSSAQSSNLQSLISLSQILDGNPTITTTGHINNIVIRGDANANETSSSSSSSSGGNSNNNNNETIIHLCYLPYLIGFSENGIPDNSLGTYEGLAAVSLALEHLNTGNGIIVPEISDIDERCPLRFYSDSYDTTKTPAMGLDQLIQLTDPDDDDDDVRLVPCAILGASKSSVSIATAAYGSLRDLVQISPLSTSTLLDDQDQYPLFGRTIPSDDGTAMPLLDLLASWGTNHVAIVHSNDQYGNAYVDAIEQHAATKTSSSSSSSSSFVIQSFHIYNKADDVEIARVVGQLKDTQYRYFFLILSNPSLLDGIMIEAYRRGIAGTGMHVWLFGDSLDGSVSGRTFPLGSPLERAYRGTGVLRATGGTYGMMGFDALNSTMRSLRDNDEDMSYLDAHLPRYTEGGGGSVNHTEVTSLGTFLSNPGFVAPFVYDAVIALGLAACNLTTTPPPERINFTGHELYWKFVDTSFEGASGSVEFINATGSRDPNSSMFSLSNFVIDDGTENDDRVTFKKVETDMFVSGRWEKYSPYIFADGTKDNPPPDLPPLEHDPNHLSTAIKCAGLMLCGIVIALSISFGVWTYRNRGVQVVRASQPIFLYIISSGTLLMGSAIIPMSLDEGWVSPEGADASCMPIPWLIFTGWSLTFSALFTKTWRIKTIMNNAAKFKRIKLTPTDVMKPMIALLLVNIIILTVWTIIDPRYYHIGYVDLDDFGRVVETKSFCSSEHQKIFLGVLAGINLGSLAFTLVQAYQARKISTEYSESNCIFIAMWTILYASLLGIPVIIIVNNNVSAVYFLQAGLLFVICSSILLLIFLPKIIASRKKKETSTPINRWTRAGEDNRPRSGIQIVSLGKTAIEQENLELKNLVEELSRKIKDHETLTATIENNPNVKEEQTHGNSLTDTLMEEEDKEKPITALCNVDET